MINHILSHSNIRRFLQGALASFFLKALISLWLYNNPHQDERKVSVEKESFSFKVFVPLVQASMHKCCLIKVHRRTSY